MSKETTMEIHELIPEGPWDEIEPAILTILQAHNAIENLGKDSL